MGAPLTEECIRKLRELIVSGQLAPGARIPTENELAAMLGSSRNTIREAVRALATARVLDVRRGDGTYVTSLEPMLLLEGISLAVDLMQPENLIEIFELRRILEPTAAAMAAERRSPTALADLRDCFQAMQSSANDPETLGAWDAKFHTKVVESTQNQTLASILNGISSRTVRARIWRGISENGSAQVTIAQHGEILHAIESREPEMARAAALLHLGTTESWFRHLESEASHSLTRKRVIAPLDRPLANINAETSHTVTNPKAPAKSARAN